MPKNWEDARIERIIGNLLRSGVLAAALVVTAGAAVFLVRHGGEAPAYGVFHGEPSELRSVGAIVGAAFTGRGRALMQLGMLLLVGTPVARVAFSVVGFAVQRDRTYVAITLLVLGALVFSLAGGHF